MYWSWKIGGIVLGLTFFLAVVLVKPIGVSTQFVITDGIFAHVIYPELVLKDQNSITGYGSPNAYLNKSGGKYAKAVAKPLSYGLVFVLAMIFGGLLGRWRTPESDETRRTRQIPEHHRSRFGDTAWHRTLLAFAGGVLVLWGARLAGGCTSGHMMSGMMQTALSGYLFAAVVFAAAVPTAILLYGKRGGGR